MKAPSHPREPLIIALDFSAKDELLALVDRLDPAECRLKIGKEVFTREGPALVRQLVDRGFDIFLDLKFHDIPHTVERAVAAAADLGVWMVNVHASGGRRMLEAAAQVLATRQPRPLLIGVTLLTSMEPAELAETGVAEDAPSHELRLAALAADAGLDGVVCSAQEATILRQKLGTGLQLVTPGIRPGGAAADDQRRVMSPLQALRAGANHLVIGRPVTRAPDPVAAIADIYTEIEDFFPAGIE